MPNVDEISSSGSPLNAILRAGVELVSGGQTITFTKYTRRVLPLDGFVFWVKSSLLGDSAPPFDILGSLHWVGENTQNEAEAMSRFTILFTAEEDASQGFATVGPSDLLIGSINGDQPTPNEIRFAFSRLGFYQNASLFHYSGMAIYPPLFGQVVDDINDLDLENVVVSNSLPAWLHLSEYTPALPAYGFGNPIPLFPSFLVPNNSVPPYGVVHIGSESTEPLAGVPWLSSMSDHYQLARDRVRITLYGARNAEATAFLDCVIQYSQDYGVIGLMGSPVIRDGKFLQAELGAIAQQKVLDFEVSYNQIAIRNVARQLIRKSLTSIGAMKPYFGSRPWASS